MKKDAILEFKDSGLTHAEISRRVGCSKAYVSIVLVGGPQSRYNKSERQKEREDYMKRQAERRQITVETLRKRLLRVIAADRMVDSVLDDEEEINA